jgi:hypothetical protein
MSRGGKGASGQAAALRWSDLRFASTSLRRSVSWPRRRTHSAPCGRCVHTTATRQLTTCAAREATSLALLGAPQARRTCSNAPCACAGGVPRRRQHPAARVLRRDFRVSVVKRREPVASTGFPEIQFHEPWSRQAAVRVGRQSTLLRHSLLRTRRLARGSVARVGGICPSAYSKSMRRTVQAGWCWPRHGAADSARRLQRQA